MAVTDLSRPQQTTSASTKYTRSGSGPILLAIFLICINIPVFIYLGGFRVDPYRIYLLLAFVPLTIALISGRAGGITLADMFMALFGGWVITSLVQNHGNWGFTNGGITVVESVGAYLLARVLIRSISDYERFVRYMLVSMLALAPFVAHEFFTGRWIIGEQLGRFFDIPGRGDIVRLGFSRVHATFSHAILYGLYASIILASVFYLYRERVGRMLNRLIFVAVMTAASLSSGPLLSLVVQLQLIFWDFLTKGKWKILLVLSIIGYVVIDQLSNRTPVQIFVQTFTLSPHTGYWRILIYEFGMNNVWQNPIFGLGHHDWARPRWMGDSIDNFWLVNAMRYGIVGFGFLAIALIVQTFQIIRAQDLTQREQAARLGYLVGLAGLVFTLSTVHVWNNISSVVMFYFGAGSFLYTGRVDLKAAQPGDIAEPSTHADRAVHSEQPQLRYRRPKTINRDPNSHE